MTTHKAIRDALDAGPTEGEWKSGAAGGSIVSDRHVEHGPNGCDCVQYYGGHLIAESIAKRNLEFIAACNPAAIRALLADLDAKTEALRKVDAEWSSFWPLGPDVPSSSDRICSISPETAEIWRAIRAALKGTP